MVLIVECNALVVVLPVVINRACQVVIVVVQTLKDLTQMLVLINKSYIMRRENINYRGRLYDKFT